MPMSEGQVLDKLCQIDEYQFEHLVADLWEARGWDTTVSSKSKDRGIDVIATRSTPFFQKQVIQAKCYARDNTISSPDIQQYSSLKQQEDSVDSVLVVTTGEFTSPARQTANDLNVKLVNGSVLCRIMSDIDSSKILKNYIQCSDGEEVAGSSGQEQPNTRETTISKAIGQVRDSQRDPNDELGDDMNSSRSIYSSLISETPFEDSDELIKLPTKSNFFDGFCPVCSEFDSVWQAEYENASKPRYKCDECRTVWRWKPRLLGISKWMAYGGPQDGVKKTKEEWWKS